MKHDRNKTDPYMLDLTIDKARQCFQTWTDGLFGHGPENVLDTNLPAGHERIDVSPDGMLTPVIGCAGTLSLVMPNGTVKPKPGHAPVPDNRFLLIVRSIGRAYQYLRQITAKAVPLKTEQSLLARHAAGEDYASGIWNQWPHTIDADKTGWDFMADAVTDAFGRLGQDTVTAYLKRHTAGLLHQATAGLNGDTSKKNVDDAYTGLYRRTPSGNWPAVPDLAGPESPVMILRRCRFPDVFGKEWPTDIMITLLAAAAASVYPPPFGFLRDPDRYVEYLEDAAGARIPDMSHDPNYIRLKARTPERFMLRKRIIMDEDHLMPTFTKTFQTDTFIDNK